MRRRARLVAVALFVATACGLPHLDWDDAACVGGLGVLSPHDASQHAIGATAPEAAEDHCAICHWTRSLRPPLSSIGVFAGRAHLALAPRAATLAPLTPVLEQLPARAPPAFLL